MKALKALKAKPFQLDPKERQRFTSVVAPRTFPIAAKDAKEIELFVDEFTKSLSLAPSVGALRTEPQRKNRKVFYLRRKKATRRRDRQLA